MFDDDRRTEHGEDGVIVTETVIHDGKSPYEREKIGDRRRHVTTVRFCRKRRLHDLVKNVSENDGKNQGDPVFIVRVIA